MGDHTEEGAETSKDLSHDTYGKDLRPKDCLPPKRLWWQTAILWIAYIAMFISVLCAVDQLSFQQPLFFSFLSSCPVCVYMASGIFLAGLLVVCYLHHDHFVHEARLVDRSEVEALMRDADCVEPRLRSPEIRPEGFDEKANCLKDEVTRLKDKDLGPKGWTEYQILPLDQMLVEFLKVEDLKSYAHSSLNTLNDYVQDVTHRADVVLYKRWKKRIDTAEKKIGANSQPLQQDKAADALRAELKMLRNELADFDRYWAVGSVFRIWMIVGVIPLVVFLTMGLTPIFHPAGDGILGILNWGFLGVAGSIAAVLHGLYKPKPDLVEVGYTEGGKELGRAGYGVGLGFLAGLISYSAIQGEVFMKRGVPNLQNPAWVDWGLSVLWAIGAGFFFEKIVDYVKPALEKRLGVEKSEG